MQEDLLIYKNKIKRGDKDLTTKDYICALHFYESDVIYYNEYAIEGKVIRSPRKRPTLRNGAIPRIFPNCPASMTRPDVKRRKSPSARAQPVPSKKRRLFDDDEQLIITTAPAEDEGVLPPIPLEANEANDEILIAPNPIEFNEVKLPSNGWGIHKFEEETIICKLNRQDMRVTHSVAVQNGNSIHVQVNGRVIRGLDSTVTDLVALECLLCQINNIKLCVGYGLGLFSKRCVGWAAPKALRCDSCRSKKREDRKRVNKILKKKQKKVVKRKEQIQKLKRSNKRIKTSVSNFHPNLRYNIHIF